MTNYEENKKTVKIGRSIVFIRYYFDLISLKKMRLSPGVDKEKSYWRYYHDWLDVIGPCRSTNCYTSSSDISLTSFWKKWDWARGWIKNSLTEDITMIGWMWSVLVNKMNIVFILAISNNVRFHIDCHLILSSLISLLLVLLLLLLLSLLWLLLFVFSQS